MKIKKIISSFILLTLVFCTVPICTKAENSNKSDNSTVEGTTMEYASKLFGEEPMTVNVIVDETEWQNMLDNAKDEEYISVDLEVNNEVFSNVAIRPKGNSSLSSVTNDRYSFKVKFDKYEDEQTCYGLDKLVLNNVISDSTYMKDYIAFDMMKFIGVEGSLYNYAVITVNGEYWGLYIALEGYDNSYCKRVYGDDDGNLYNVKMIMGGGEDGGGPMPGQGNDNTNALSSEASNNADVNDTSNAETSNPSDMQNSQGDREGAPFDFTESLPEGFDIDDYIEKSAQEGFSLSNYLEELGLTEADFNIPSDSNMDLEDMLDMIAAMKSGDFTDGGMKEMGGSSTGGALLYTDDEISSYSSIFENAVFKHTDTEDEQRVIEAIKALNNGENIENCFNVDEILRYLVAHTVLCNFDSYNSSMAQNYYIYEDGGVVSILPWDYNLAFGAFQCQDATECINLAIDTPVYGVEMSERPLISQLLSNEEYLATYHEYLQLLVDDYMSNFSERVDKIVDKIDSYVQTDPTAYCTYEEYQTAVETLKSFVELRAKSIQGQLDGTIPSTTDAQKEDSSALIDASSIDLSDMGQQPGGGGGGPDGPDGPGGPPSDPSNPPNTPVSEGSLEIQMYDRGTDSSIVSIAPQYKIINTGSEAINLSDVKIRYYYTLENATSQSFWCDWSSVDSSNVTGEFVTMDNPTDTADCYLEIGFTSDAGSLASGECVYVQTRINKSDWSSYTQTNDYSFNSSAEDFADWKNVTAYISDSLQWGIEP